MSVTSTQGATQAPESANASPRPAQRALSPQALLRRKATGAAVALLAGALIVGVATVVMRQARARAARIGGGAAASRPASLG